MAPIRRHTHYHRHEADELYHAEVRAFIASKKAEGCTPKKIASILGVSVRTVQGYMNQSLQRVIEIADRGVDLLDHSPKPRTPEELEQTTHTGRRKRGAGPGPHVKRSTRGAPPPPTGSSPLGAVAATVVQGQVILPDEEVAFQKRCYNLRKQAIPFDEIARIVERPESDVRAAVKRRLEQLDAEELTSTEHSRRLMLDQLDSMIRALFPRATGEEDAYGNVHSLDYEAVDRMVRLLDRKAKLQGLDQPQKVDTRIRLETFAREAGYDPDEILEIAEDVLQNWTPALRGR